jgi:hypothetical protein
MPPYTYTTFEEIEAKEWANKTLKTLLTDVTPVSFEASDYHSSSSSKDNKPAKLVINDNSDHHNSKQKNNRGGSNNPVRRSFSFLEGNLFSTITEQQKNNNARRSQSTLLPSTSTTTNTKSHSAPTTPIVNKLSPLSNRIRDTLQHRASTSTTKNATSDTTTLSEHKKSSKEQRAITIWKNTYAQYMIETPSSLQVQV